MYLYEIKYSEQNKKLTCTFDSLIGHFGYFGSYLISFYVAKTINQTAIDGNEFKLVLYLKPLSINPRQNCYNGKSGDC